MKKLITIVLLTMSISNFADATQTLKGAVRKLNQLERSLNSLSTEVSSTKSIIRQAIQELEYEETPQIECSYVQSNNTLVAHGDTAEEAKRELMRLCVSKGISPGACSLNIQYTARCY